MYTYFYSALTALFLLTGFMFRTVPERQQREAILCHPSDPPADNMNAFASDPAFQALHLSPLSIRYQARGEMVRFRTPDGADAGGYLVKAGKKSDKWLFVYQEWWGLNDHIRKEADRFYQDLGGNVNVIALDMYDGKSTTDPREAGQIMQSVKEERLQNIVKGAVELAGRKARIASVGWCFGGGWSLKSALIEGSQAVGCVMYYGMPVRDAEKLKTLNTDVLGLFATEQYISREVIEEFAAKMKEADKKLEYRIFSGVHGFANPSNPKYDPALAAEAYGMALAYLKKRLS
jgi:carboxymethylenebutenolidase